ncbi:hypothetical protein BEI02_14810 [Elizabethkingia sp. HvH-WGS333]|uniref:DUF6268 family outer membrane beta-barrel protein n=1 Tax=Elizabethkingia TaxID=308865 RepID=UPI0007415B1E|nr:MULTISPECIES: DUF6268 family outer membrane beta-barrel protein [Elizabethkingia]KUG12775.1 hypothetical protein AMC91_06035 [Elizabethkingia miricola]MCL1656759.1 DUF6268 family outer membrane beta-barrel protein [Elizabethkingia miricola]MCP1252580.1 DUF6268 family outer membrane beta-barrel protein [Elizabethkingia sp. S0634]OIK46516.1 hypothetical protein BEI02_14810 [Elizabethkingia sp. HvH-WGS333]
MKTLLILKNRDYRSLLHGINKAITRCLYLCLIASFTIFFSNRIHAQIIQDIGGISVTSHSKATFRDLPLESPDPENKFRLNTYDAWIPIPPVRIGKTSIFGNLNYRLMDFNYDNNIEDPNRLKRIQEIKPTIIIRHPISEKWSVLAIAMPALAGEKSVSIDNLVLDGILGVSKKFGPESNFEIGVGVHALHSFGETLITPGISIDYRSTDNKWLAQFYWPRLNVLYNVSPNTQIGLAGSIDWTRFKLKSFRGYNGKEADYAQFSSIHGGLQVNQRIAGGIWLQVQGGAGLFNSYELFDKNQKTVNNFTVSNMAYGKVTLTYRIGKK